MQMSLILLGALCIIAAIIGGGVEFNPLRIPRFESIWRQALLAAFGAVLIIGSLVGPFLSRWVETAFSRETRDSGSNDIAANEAARAPVVDSKGGRDSRKPTVPAGQGKPSDSIRPDRPAPPPDTGLSGEWRGNYNVEYQIVQEGTRLQVSKVRALPGLQDGKGSVRGREIEWTWIDLPCSGEVAADRQTITIECRNGTNPDVLRRVRR